MIAFLLRRLLQSLLTLLIVSIVVFTIVQIAPGDPAIVSNDEIGAADAEQFRENLGLNDPIWEQYLRWLGGVASRRWTSASASSTRCPTSIW